MQNEFSETQTKMIENIETKIDEIDTKKLFKVVDEFKGEVEKIRSDKRLSAGAKRSDTDSVKAVAREALDSVYKELQVVEGDVGIALDELRSSAVPKDEMPSRAELREKTGAVLKADIEMLYKQEKLNRNIEKMLKNQEYTRMRGEIELYSADEMLQYIRDLHRADPGNSVAFDIMTGSGKRLMKQKTKDEKKLVMYTTEAKKWADDRRPAVFGEATKIAKGLSRKVSHARMIYRDLKQKI